MHPQTRFNASTGGATYAVSSLSRHGTSRPNASCVRRHNRREILETTQGMHAPPDRLAWSRPDALLHTSQDRSCQQGCWMAGRSVPQTPTWYGQFGATAGSQACAFTDGTRHGPERSDQRNQRLEQALADRRTDHWPAVCAPQCTNPHQSSTAACRPHQLTPTDSALPPLRGKGAMADSTSNHTTDFRSRARRTQPT